MSSPDRNAAPVWFITGCSSGFGKELCRVVRERGGRLIATARDTSSLGFLTAGDDVLTAPLDVTDAGQVRAAVAAAVEKFGRIDVLVNNAGYGLMGSVEETPEDEVRRQFEVNLFGLLAVTRAVLPHMRSAKSGHVLLLSSIAGQIARAATGFYSASKHAVEAVGESLSAELGPLGIRVTIVEPSGFRTDFHGRSLSAPDSSLPDYAETAAAGQKRVRGMDGTQAGDARKAAELMWQVTRLPDPPLRLPLGNDAIDVTRAQLDKIAADLDRCEAAARSADGEGALVDLA